MIGATTISEYRKYIEKDKALCWLCFLVITSAIFPHERQIINHKMTKVLRTLSSNSFSYVALRQALERRFQPVNVPEPTNEETLTILHGLAKKYEDCLNVGQAGSLTGNSQSVAGANVTSFAYCISKLLYAAIGSCKSVQVFLPKQRQLPASGASSAETRLTFFLAGASQAQVHG